MAIYQLNFKIYSPSFKKCVAPPKRLFFHAVMKKDVKPEVAAKKWLCW